MYRLWGKIMKNNDMKDDHVFEIDNPKLRKDEKLKESIEGLCHHFDLQRPMWFSDNEKDMKQFNKTQFLDHHFIESINFDYLEIEIIEDDD
jgi:hypothetical protein